MKRLVSGIQATGDIHLGNYVGMVRQAVALQASHEAYLFVADLHALNTVHDPEKLRRNTLEIVKAYLALGVDPEKTALFRQSDVPAHAILSVILSSSTGHGLLERAHAYKDAMAKGKAINAGTFYYPVLMAADILLYKPEKVPVGSDQQQHLEMTREIAERFNATYGETFPLPEAEIMKESATIPGLDGRKMSKSYENVIGLFDAPDLIRDKVARITTDSRRPEEPKDPSTDTIFAIYKEVAGAEHIAELKHRYEQGGIGYKEAKDHLAEALLAYLAPIQARKAELDANEDQVREIMSRGAQRAGAIATETLEEVYTKIGVRP